MSKSTEWQIQGTRVYTTGKGKSFNCINKITANQLYHILTTYEKEKHTEKNYDKIIKQLTQIQMTLKILEHEIQELKEVINK